MVKMNKFMDVTVSDNTLHMTTGFTKVDEERRLVIGFASANNPDKQDHIIDADANREAFAKWVRNIREMHGTEAVGSALDIAEADVVDPNTGKVYDGVVISAYISKGAPNAWEKVLDGTYKGFSIGGRILEKEEYFDAELNRFITKILKYELVEVSLVDNPANPLAQVLSIAKVDSYGNLEGAAAQVELANVLYCNTCDVAVPSKADTGPCVICKEPMQNVGWVEKLDDYADDIRKMIAPFRKSVEANTTEGGVNMPEEKKTDDNELLKPDGTVKAEDAEQSGDGPDVKKADDEKEADGTQKPEAGAPVEATAGGANAGDLERTGSTVVEDKVEDKTDETEKSEIDLDALAAKVAELLAAKVSKTEEVTKSEVAVKVTDTDALSVLVKSVGELADVVKTLDGRLKNVEGDGAVKKSSEVETVQKKESFWGGTLIPSTDDL